MSRRRSRAAIGRTIPVDQGVPAVCGPTAAARLRPCPPSAPRAARATCCRPRRADLARLERLAADLAARYGYRRIETPLFEQTDVFERGVGEVTDVVEKELFRLAPRTEEGERGRSGRSRPRASSAPTSSTGCRPGRSR